jgi:perosamine synthetase
VISDESAGQLHIPPFRYSFNTADVDRIVGDIEELFRSGAHLTIGAHGASLEREFAAYCATRYAIAVASGTAALELILRALDVAGGEVIVPTNTFGATVTAVLRADAIPVLADIGEDMSISVVEVERRMTPATKAVITVHIGGLISPETTRLADRCAARGVPLVEDAAHAIGSRLSGRVAGSIGVAAAYSLFSTKVITSGEGGLIATNDERVRAVATQLRDHAKEPDGTMLTTGYNWRLSEMQAIVARTQLARLDEIIAQRNEVAQRYDTALEGLAGVHPLPVPDDVVHNRYKYIVLLDGRLPSSVQRRLAEHYDVTLGGYVYQTPCHQQQAFKDYATGEYPTAERLCASHICPPLYAGMSQAEQEHATQALRDVLSVGVGAAANRAERAQLFAWVYDNNQWGRSPNGDRFYSDSPQALAASYREYVARFVRDHGVRTVVDLGCGDHANAAAIDLGDAYYIGVDIYDELITENNRRFGDDQHEFLVADIVDDELPDGDLCLLSAVLYLMSHADAQKVLAKVRKYPHVLITDGQPDLAPGQRRNVDKPTDKYTRRDYYGTGFYLELPPFDLDLRVVHEYRLPTGEVMRTVLIDNAGEHKATV